MSSFAYLVAKAKRNRILVPQPCETCGTENRVQAHHDDYTKPTVVRWLCLQCHRRLHAARRDGKRNERQIHLQVTEQMWADLDMAWRTDPRRPRSRNDWIRSVIREGLERKVEG